MFSHRVARRGVAALSAPFLAGLLCLAGCGGGVPKGEVSGKVTFEGKPVKEGRVTLIHKETGNTEEALLDTDGTFSLRAPVPVGEYKATVMPLIVKKRDDPKGGPVVGVEKPAPDIPEKYRTPGSTELKATVQEGKNAFTFDMKR